MKLALNLRRLAVFSLPLLSACASMTTYNKARTVNPVATQQAFVDAKQRVIFTVPVTTTAGGVTTSAVRICAEPSPDALSALAASASGGLSVKDQASLQAAFALSETASTIGLRTQSIQLMRDAMYRLCEGVSSGMLSSTQFETLHRRFQNSMVAILAIEQLTGAVRPGSAQLSTTAGAGAAKEVAALTESTVKARQGSAAADATAAASAATLEKASAAADAYLAANGGAVETFDASKKAEYAKLTTAVTDAAKAKAPADTAAATAKEKLATYETGMRAIGSGNLATSGTATISSSPNGALAPEAVNSVATAVSDIVSAQLGLGFFREACATLFIAQIDGRVTASQSADLIVNCKEYAAATVNQLVVSNAVDQAYANNIEMQTREKMPLTGAVAKPPVNPALRDVVSRLRAIPPAAAVRAW